MQFLDYEIFNDYISIYLTLSNHEEILLNIFGIDSTGIYENELSKNINNNLLVEKSKRNIIISFRKVSEYINKIIEKFKP